MTRYPEHSPPDDPFKETSETLEFPVAPDFSPLPVKIDLQAMLQRIEDNMPWRNSRPGEAERRLAEKIPVEFVL
jgi:hypothetical protein